MFQHAPPAITPLEKCVRFLNRVQQPLGKNHVTHERTDITSSLHQYSVLFPWTARKTPESCSFLVFFPLSLSPFVTPVFCLKCQENKAQQGDAAYFFFFLFFFGEKKSLGVDRGLELLTSVWENSFHLEHWNQAALSGETMMVMTRHFVCRVWRETGGK